MNYTILQIFSLISISSACKYAFVTDEFLCSIGNIQTPVYNLNVTNYIQRKLNNITEMIHTMPSESKNDLITMIGIHVGITCFIMLTLFTLYHHRKRTKRDIIAYEGENNVIINPINKV